MHPDDLLCLEQVEKDFGDFTALAQVTLRVNRGAFVLLLGANGAGKSTLLRLLAGLSKPTRGRVLVAGAEPHHAAASRAAVGLLSHSTLLYDDLSALENLSFFARLYGLPDPDTRVAQALEAVGLAERHHHRVRTFSRGMKQRLALARATLHNPSVLLFDEPYTGLDQRAAAALSHQLRQLKEQGRTSVLVTHNLEEAVHLADRLVILRRGRVGYDAPWAGGSIEDLGKLYEQHLG
ncbi:MAG: heme ABC exporter ATP-binding protein CcmA [Candidatus Latescibacteria bacterium]|nr:heme ABC exporter ATP-binding protein CcmA [Candidatus Latescibacterota bacterium]